MSRTVELEDDAMLNSEWCEALGKAAEAFCNEWNARMRCETNKISPENFLRIRVGDRVFETIEYYFKHNRASKIIVYGRP